MTKSKLWHIILMVGGALAVLAPDLASLAQVLSGLETPWLKWPIRVIGIFALIGSRWDKIRARLEKLGPPSNSTPVINGPGAAAALLLACSLLLSGQARAAEPQFGGSVLGGDLAFGPAATITVGRYQAGKFSAGVMPGACYEAVAWPDTWHSLGLSFCGQLSVGGSEANQGGVSGLLSFANWFRAGVGEVWTEQAAGPAKRDTALLFGFGTMLGGSPKYVASQGAR